MSRQAAVFLMVLVLGCGKKTERGDAPPPSLSASASSASVCAGGGGKVTDAPTSAMFPRHAAAYCLDPNGETRAYGQAAPTGIDGVCLEQFNGECEVYKGYGLDRLVTARYVDGRGGSGEVSVALSRFASKDGAYGFFCRRLLGGADPLRVTTDPLPAGGAGALGTGMAYVWRGLYVLQLTYSNVSEAPDQLKASSQQILPQLAGLFGQKIPGDLAPPAAVSLIPSESRLKLGMGYEIKDLLGVSGVGGGAIGYHQDGARRYRTIAAVKSDDAAAKDVLGTLGKLAGARTEKGLTFEAVSFSLRDTATNINTEWVVGRQGKAILGIGDEEYALGGAQGPEETSRTNLPRDTKLERLRRWVGGGPPAVTSAHP